MRMHALRRDRRGRPGPVLVGDIGEDGVRKSTFKANQTAAAMQNLTDVVKELNDLKPALLATPTPGALSSATPNYPTPKDWRIAALQSVIPLISNYADKQWYQSELYALTAAMPDYSLSSMLHQASPQRSYIRTRVAVVNGLGYIIAYNYGNTAIKGATFTWQSNLSSVIAFREGTDSQAGRSIAPSGPTFKDDFAPYEAHVYIVY
jgi:hypothetical protein